MTAPRLCFILALCSGSACDPPLHHVDVEHSASVVSGEPMWCGRDSTGASEVWTCTTQEPPWDRWVVRCLNRNGFPICYDATTRDAATTQETE